MSFRKNTPNGEDEINEEELEKAGGGAVTPDEKYRLNPEIPTGIIPKDIVNDTAKKIIDK